MKRTVLVCMAFACLMAITSCGKKKAVNEEYDNLKKSGILKKDVKELAKDLKLENDGDSLSYLLGITIGDPLHRALTAPEVHPDLKGFDSKEFMEGLVAAFETDTTQTSYDMGLMQGLNIKNATKQFKNQYGLDLDVTTVCIALKQALAGDSTLLIPAEQANMLAQMILQNAQIRKLQEEEERLANSPEAKKNLADGEAFLAQKAQEEGVQKTESGVLYKVNKPGTGEKIKPTQRAVVSYKGTLIDGTQFDANANATFSPRGVVPGFGEALLLMQKGGEYTVYIPAELGYGVRGSGEKIPTNSVLVFDVTVLDIK